MAPVPVLIVLTNVLAATHASLVIGSWITYGVLMVACATIQDHFMRKHQLRVHRADFGLCLACGYNLRGIAGRCPECGTEIATQSEL